jgi:transposase-like protein
MPIFKALKKLMLILRRDKHMGMRGAVESDEVYVTAGLKGRNNSERIRRIGGKPRRRGLKRRGRGAWGEDKPAVFILVGRGGGEDYIPSGDVESETVLKIVGRHVLEGSTIYTDFFKSYLGLGEAGYRHEAVNHSDGEWVRGECHINGCENRASLLRPWLAVHRGICRDNLSLYLASFKAYRKSRSMKPTEAIKEILKNILISTALIAIIKEHINPKATIQPQHFYLRAKEKAEEYGIEVEEKSEYKTSSKCPLRHSEDTTTRGRLFKCLCCGLEANRDAVG